LSVGDGSGVAGRKREKNRTRGVRKRGTQTKPLPTMHQQTGRLHTHVYYMMAEPSSRHVKKKETTHGHHVTPPLPQN